MKKTFLCLLLGALCTPCTLTAQLKVQGDGSTKGTLFFTNTVKNNETVFSRRIGLNDPNNFDTTPKSTFAIGSVGNTSTTAYILYNNSVGMQVRPASQTYVSLGIQSLVAPTFAQSNVLYNPFNLAVRGVAGNHSSLTTKRSIGVSALLCDKKDNGSALYAGITESEFTHDGRYAAYINGNA
ncbi:MAG: hypothetical protein J6Y77_05075, partial [Paludibacteraceae bacterium]|nr:hypothetical protein [Paludibacteraceae bacterium]